MIDTGKSVSKIEVFSNRAMSKLKNELFHRIKPNSLAKLLFHNNLQIDSNTSDFFPRKVPLSPSHQSISSLNTEVVSEIFEFIIIDLRSHEDYLDYHIKNSISYPRTEITKDKTHPELFRIKNKEGKLIIAYTQDERSGVEVAQILAQKNYSNLYLLTGGLKDFSKLYPSLIES